MEQKAAPAQEVANPEGVGDLASHATAKIEETGGAIIDMVFTVPNGLIMLFAWAMVWALSKFTSIFEGKKGRKRKEAAPVPICMAAILIPGAADPSLSMAETIFMGAILGMATEWIHQKWVRIVMGKGRVADERSGS